jgi:hypothetical protein
MRLVGVSMVRNEGDVIESHVRHNLAVLDGLTIIDHGSRDGTSEILASLQQEGLALRVARDTNPGFFQAEQMTLAVRETLARDDADFAFALDADEFLKVGSREELEASLRAVRADEHAVLGWLTYVPSTFGQGDPFVGPPQLRHRLRTEWQQSYKSVVGRSFVRRSSQYLVSGNHLVDDSACPNPPRHLRLSRDVAALAHYPVRSRTQLERKVILGYLAHRATRPSNDRQAFHWRELFSYLRDGGTLDDNDLQRIASNYGLPREAWQPIEAIQFVEDPVVLNGELRYSRDANVDTLHLLMAFTEDLLR